MDVLIYYRQNITQDQKLKEHIPNVVRIECYEEYMHLQIKKFVEECNDLGCYVHQEIVGRNIILREYSNIRRIDVLN